MAKDTDNARITELQNKVNALASRTLKDPAGTPGNVQEARDIALGMLSARTEILGVKGTP